MFKKNKQTSGNRSQTPWPCQNENVSRWSHWFSYLTLSFKASFRLCLTNGTEQSVHITRSKLLWLRGLLRVILWWNCFLIHAFSLLHISSHFSFDGGNFVCGFWVLVAMGLICICIGTQCECELVFYTDMCIKKYVQCACRSMFRSATVHIIVCICMQKHFSVFY